MNHLGDITKISGYTAPIVDCIIGGSPCQDLSVAGKRAGLDGERSGLFMEQIRITKEMREKDGCNGRTGEFIRPRFGVWENVPGALSSNKGEDFKAVLEEFAKVVDKDAVIPMPPKGKWNTSGCILGDGWSIAWRILDAQFWGVPQRRRRITLVADFGGRCAPEILFERKGLSRHSSQSREERKDSPTDAQGGIVADDREGEKRGRGYVVGADVYNTALTGDVACTLTSEGYTSTGTHPKVVIANALGFDPQAHRDVGQYVHENIANTLTNGTNPGWHNGVVVAIENHPADSRVNIDDSGNVPMVMEAVDCYNQALTGDKTTCLRSNSATDADHVPCVVMDRSAYNQGVNAKFDIGIDENGVAFSCIAKGPGAVCYCLQGNQIDQADTSVCNGSGWKEDTSYTLNTRDKHSVAYGFYPQMKAESIVWTEEKAGCLVNGTNPGFHNGVCITKPHYIVRRLTPMECERLQGYPDHWTDIGEYTDSKGKVKKTSDSARYKALGNSIALPPWKWVIKRLCSHYERDATMASLFDGIGGFPYIWEQINGKGSCLWASEIEDFPIAVTQKRID